MGSWQQKLYDASSWPIRRRLVALEAVRRNRYRRYGDYDACRLTYTLDTYRELSQAELARLQRRRLNTLLRYARVHSPFYQERLRQYCGELVDLKAIPVLSKELVRKHQLTILDESVDHKHLWKGRTSGSTGTPLSFFVGREGIRARTAIQDNYYELFACHYGERRARFGGSQVVPVSTSKAPFWVYNKPDNQLQMSAYHLDHSTLPEYVRALEHFNPLYVTGYAHAQYQVAKYLCQAGGLANRPRALFSDSEGLSDDHHAVVQRGFGAPSYDVYGLAEVGWVAVQCTRRRYHVLDSTCVLEVLDDSSRPVPDGEVGRLVVTDLTQTSFPFIRYDTGDAGALSTGDCSCGIKTTILERIEGRSDDLIVTPRGRQVGRLSHVTKPGRGILESQIAQTSSDRVVVRVVPAADFERASMTEVVHVAHRLLGDEMRVDWELVDHIPRTSVGHKFKHVVRELSN